MQNIVKHLSLCMALFASFTLHAQSNADKLQKAAVETSAGNENARGQVFVAAKKDDLPNDPYRSAVFISPVSGTATLTLNIPLTHSVKQPYVTFENLTKGTYIRYTTFPGESTYRTVPATLQAGDQYRLTAHILPNPSDPNDDTDEDVLATLSW
jgi:hypothetical protein